MTGNQILYIGKKIKLLLVEKDLNQNILAKSLNVSNSLLSDKLNGKVKINVDELYHIIVFLNENDIHVDANYFLQPLSTPEISDTNLHKI